MTVNGDASANVQAILSMLGLAARSRRLVVGTEAVLSAVRSKAKPHIVVAASDISDRTRKQLTDKCAYYGVRLIFPDADRAALAAAVGKKNAQCSACAVTDSNMAKKTDILYNG